MIPPPQQQPLRDPSIQLPFMVVDDYAAQQTHYGPGQLVNVNAGHGQGHYHHHQQSEGIGGQNAGHQNHLGLTHMNGI